MMPKASVKLASISLNNKSANAREETKTKMRMSAKRGENHSCWKGEKVGYVGLHRWVRKCLGKPKICNHCGNSGVAIQWANVSGEYKRNLTDWINLCVPGHRIYDKGKEKLKDNYKLKK